METKPDALTLMRAILDSFDDVCRVTDDLLNVVEYHSKRLEPFADLDITQDTFKQLLADLPPERVAALMEAIDDITKLTPVDSPPNKEEELNKIRTSLDSLKKIRSNFHFALDGVVQ